MPLARLQQRFLVSRRFHRRHDYSGRWNLSASRLARQRIYGTSNIVWANIVGLILIYLTVGYFIGGRWPIAPPISRRFTALITWAAFFSGLVPLVVPSDPDGQPHSRPELSTQP